MTRPLTCHHRCRCGAELSCGDPDRCPIGSTPWLCQACELDAMTDYYNSIEPQPQHDPQPSLTRIFSHEKH